MAQIDLGTYEIIFNDKTNQFEVRETLESPTRVRRFPSLDGAMEWVTEDARVAFDNRETDESE